MGIYAFSINRNQTTGYHKQRFVTFAKRNGKIQKRSGKSLITPQIKLGKTEDEILNKIITELQYSIE